MRTIDAGVARWYLQSPGLTDLPPLPIYPGLARNGTNPRQSLCSHIQSVSDAEDVSVPSWADTAGACSLGLISDSTGPADDDAPVVVASSDSTGPSIRGGGGTSAAIISSVILSTNARWTVRYIDAMACQFLKTLLSKSLSSNQRRSMATLQGLMHGC